MQDVYVRTIDQIEEFEEKYHKKVIDVAWDRRQQQYVAYEAGAKYIGIGVSVSDAKSAFIAEYWDAQNDVDPEK